MIPSSETGTTLVSSLWPHWGGEVSPLRQLTTSVHGYAEWRLVGTCTCSYWMEELQCNNGSHLLAGWSDGFPDHNRAPPPGGLCEGRAERDGAQNHGCAGTTQSHHYEPFCQRSGLDAAFVIQTHHTAAWGLVISSLFDSALSLPAIVRFSCSHKSKCLTSLPTRPREAIWFHLQAQSSLSRVTSERWEARCASD